MTFTPRQSQDSLAMPYSDTETDYQDYDNNDGGPLPIEYSQTGSRASSFYSFVSSVHTTSSLRSKKSSRSRKSVKKVVSEFLSSNENDIQLRGYGNRNGSTSDYDEDLYEDYEYDTAVKPYRKPFYRRRRFWCYCAILTVVFLAIFIPLFLIVILPKVAQAIMNGSTMQIAQLNMTNPQENSVQVSVNAAIIGIPTIFAATVEFQEPVQVFWLRGPGDQPRVGQMSLGTINKRAFAKAEFTQATTFGIADSQLFGEFAKIMMASETFVWRITAKINVVVLGRTIKDLTLDKTLNLDGLSNFANLKILSFDIPSDAPNGTGALVSIQVSIPNPSPIGMSLGTMEIDMNLKTAYLGRITARNATLVGGQPTILSLEGTILKQTDPESLLELSNLITNYLTNTPTTAYGQGVSVLPDGVHAVSWITAAIVATKMTIPLLPPTPINVIKQVNVKDLSLLLTPQQPWTPTAASSGIAAAFRLPFNLSLNITNIWDPILTLGYQDIPVADISSAVWDRNSSDMTQNNITFILPSSPMPIRPDAHDQFGKFLIAATQQDSFLVEILGSAQSSAVTSIGQVNITVPFNTSLSLPGVNFSKMVPQLTGIAVTGATVNYLIINATVIIQNPSVFAVEAGPTVLHVNGTTGSMTEYMGDVLIPDLKLVPGSNSLQAQFHFQPNDDVFRNAFLTEYILGSDFDISLYGGADSSSVASIVPLMESLRMSTTLPGMSPVPKLVVGGNGNTTVGEFIGQHQVMLQVQILNPLATTLWVQSLSANVTWKGFPFGTIQLAQTFSINPSGIDTTPLFAIHIPTSYQFWTFMITTFLPQNLGVLTGATVVIDMTASIIVSIGGPVGVGYQSGVNYSQDQVGIFLKIEFNLAGLGIGKRRRKRGILEESYSDLDELGPEPDRRDGDAYLAWLKRAVQLTYPDEAAADGWM
ncbi:hypothetical protein BGZ80_001763 [Entomortierella chlamydospora]|uniref:Pre-rrna processing protein n=1 Tax=Entomortierella chlamydospora TaxID=101097 RepID=A0A9P6MRM7_9FUNG|nr:hypothetical protein BGZ79_005858 [Entomortierella chlamydospora]KAG0010125.1 hypothetical protein BGZ80_001763 [Entomortierella chlamydospora]